MKLSELKEIIRKVVAEEVGRQLPRVLSEMYVRGIVAEHVSARGGGDIVGPAAVASRPPQPTRAAIREQIRRSVLETDENPLKGLYEGVEPIPGEGEPGGPSGDGIPLEALGSLGIDGARLAAMAGIPTQTDVTPSRGPIPETAEMKMRRIEMHRARLDARRVG